MRTKITRVALLCLGLGLGQSGVAHAESEAVCHKYAEKAVAAFYESQALDCRLSDGRWNGNGEGHYKWCRGASPGHVQLEEAARANKLRVCRHEPAGVECNKYAINTVSQQRSNLSGNCGFKEGRWTDDYDQHLSWCLSRFAQEGNYNGPNSEFNIRQIMLGACDRQQPNLRCDEYARRAVADINEANARGCIMSGPPGRWTSGYEGHLTWCMGEPPEKAESETRERGGPLSQCRTTNPLPP